MLDHVMNAVNVPWLNHVMHAVGVVCLVGMAGVSFWIIASEIIPNRRKIMDAYLAAFAPPVGPAAIVEEQLAEPAPRARLRIVEDIA